MQYELNILDDMVLNKLNPDVPNQSLTNDFWEQCFLIARNSSSEIKNNFIYQSLILKKKKVVKHYISVHQSRLIFLSDYLFSNILNSDKSFDYTSEKPYDSTSCMKSVFLIIDDLLIFIELNFPKYLNYDLDVPKRSAKNCKRILKKSISENLANPLILQYKICSLIVSEIQKLLENIDYPFTFTNTKYLKIFISDFQKQLKNEPNDNFNEKIKKLLITYNFNSWIIFDFLVDEIRTSIQTEESIKIQIEKYYWHLKWLNQIHLKPHVALFAEQKSLKEMLCNWIAEEIFFIEKGYQLNFSTINETKDIEKSSFSTTLSVHQIAYLTRLFIDTGIIKTTNHKKLFSTITKSIPSKNAEKMSEMSFSNKYYNVEIGTKEKVKSLILKILNEIQKN